MSIFRRWPMAMHVCGFTKVKSLMRWRQLFLGGNWSRGNVPYTGCDVVYIGPVLSAFRFDGVVCFEVTLVTFGPLKGEHQWREWINSTCTVICCFSFDYPSGMGEWSVFIVLCYRCSTSPSHDFNLREDWAKIRQDLLYSIPWTPKTMKHEGFGHLTTRLFTQKQTLKMEVWRAHGSCTSSP